MSGLDKIGIKVGEGAVPGNARALLSEIETMLQALLARGQPGTIDLRGLPMLPQDYGFLQQMLGEGEVEAMLDALGLSHIRETAFPGVWWITHYNHDHEVMADMIEVTFLPDILKSPREDISRGLSRLQQRLLEASG